MSGVALVLAIPVVAALLLALVGDYRLGARLNMLACAGTLAAAVAVLLGPHDSGELIFIDDFNVYLVLLTAIVGFSTSVFSASYIGHEIEIGRLTLRNLRFYHAMYQAFLFTMLLALVANNLGMMWVAVEGATLATALMVSLYRTPEA